MVVKEMMRKYGIDRVRGGSYSSHHLSQNQIRALETEIRGASGSCFRCGGNGHWARDCPDNNAAGDWDNDSGDWDDDSGDDSGDY